MDTRKVLAILLMVVIQGMTVVGFDGVPENRERDKSDALRSILEPMALLVSPVTPVTPGSDNRTGKMFSGGKEDGFSPSCLPPLVVKYGPQEFSCVADSIVLWIKAEGTMRQYRWQKLVAAEFKDVDTVGGRIRGSFSDRMVITSVDKSKDDGTYRCLVYNNCGETASDTFRISVNSMPVLQAGLNKHQSFLCVGDAKQKLSIAVTALNSNFDYTWSLVDTITGVRRIFDPEKNNHPYLEVDTKSRAGEGLYVVEARNECGSVSDSVYQRVYMPITIEDLNIDDRVINTCVGENVSMTVKVDGGGSYTYALKKVAIQTAFPLRYTQISVADSGRSQAIFKNVTSDMAGTYVWEVSNNCGRDTSEVFTLKIYKEPVFKDQISDTLVCEGSTLRLYAEAVAGKDYGNVEYYWRHNGEDIGAAGPELILPAMSKANEGVYLCYAHNVCGRHTASRPIKVTMDPLPQFLRNPFMYKDICIDDTVDMSVRYTAIHVDSMRWRLNDHSLYDDGVKFAGTTTSDFSVYRITEEEAGLYSVAAYNRCGVTYSEYADLKLNRPATIVKSLGGYGVDLLLCAGTDQKLSVKATGSTPIRYRWLCADRVIAESDSSFAVIKGSDIKVDVEYTVHVENMCGGESISAMLRVARIKSYKLTGGGEYCDGHQATGDLKLVGSDTNILYSLNREPGEAIVKDIQGTGDTLKFSRQERGIYYMTGLDTNGCVQKMENTVTVNMLPSPVSARLILTDEYCLGNDGANVLQTIWENRIEYKLYRLYGGADWVYFQNRRYLGGAPGSPAEGEKMYWEGLDVGRYKVVAKNLFNGCTREYALEDSIELRPAPRKYVLYPNDNDYVNCSQEAQLTELRTDGYESGSEYSLLKDGLSFGQVLRYTPLRWAHINEGNYILNVKNKWGCQSQSKAVKITNIISPEQRKLTGNGSICNGDTDKYKQLTIANSQPGVIYTLYRDYPETKIDTLWGNGSDRLFLVSAKNAAYYVEAEDRLSGKCKVRMEDKYVVGISDFQAQTMPSEIFLSRGLRTRMHLEVKGNYSQPVVIHWEPSDQIEWGAVLDPNTQEHRQYYWPFCPCASKHEYYGSYGNHGYSHGPGCDGTNCPLIYHTWNPSEHGCVYQGTVQTMRNGSMVNWYNLYYCHDQETDDGQIDQETGGLPNPFKDPLTKTVYNDITYRVTMTDGVGCTQTDSVKVKINGKKLDAEIMFSNVHMHYYAPFCPCCNENGYRHYYHSLGCNDDNCYLFYHRHKHEGCTFQKTEKILYRGAWTNYYDFYYCCTDIEAQDTIAWKNEELFFCSKVDGGDYKYRYEWSFVSGDGDVTTFGERGDTVQFKAKKSGYLYMDVYSMGQHRKDSLWIEVMSKPLESVIRDGECVSRLDSAILCVGERIELCGWAKGGDGPHTYLWYDKENPFLSSANHIVYKPDKSGYVWFVTTSDGVEVKDSIYIKLMPSPQKMEILDPGVRCVQLDKDEIIKLPATEKGINYVLEYHPYGRQYSDYGQHFDNADGKQIVFSVKTAVQDAGMYRVRADRIDGDKVCSTYTDSLDFIAPPSPSLLADTTYCFGEFGAKIRILSSEADMHYSICSHIGTVLETIKKPMTEFVKLFQEAPYIYRVDRIGILGKCTVDRPFQVIRSLDPEKTLDVITFPGDTVCEGMEVLITVKATELNVKYELITPEDRSVDSFMGNGGDMTFGSFPRPAGTYLIRASKEKCVSYLDKKIRMNSLPRNLELKDTSYCYTYPAASTSVKISVEAKDLQDQIKYYLYQGKNVLDSVEGPGTKQFKAYTAGDYYVIAKDKRSNCMSEAAKFAIKGNSAPYPFELAAKCGAVREVALAGSQVSVTYFLWRDALQQVSLQGTGNPITFGEQRLSGVYRVYGVDNTTGCEAFMTGSVPIYEIDTCKVQVKGAICADVRGGGVDFYYPHSNYGWTYYIKLPATGKESEKLAGTGGELWWSAVGGAKIRNGEYELWAENSCDTLRVQKISVPLYPKLTGEIIRITSACRDADVEIIVKGNPEVTYELKEKVEGYENSLYTCQGKDDQFSMGVYRNKKHYVLYGGYENKSCYRSVDAMDMEISRTPETLDIIGRDTCMSTGTAKIQVCLPEAKESDINYYLSCNSNVIDSLTPIYRPSEYCFSDQNRVGYYQVWAIYKGTNCRDTMNGQVTLGGPPQQYHVMVDSLISGITVDSICRGESRGILLAGSETDVLYQLLQDGRPLGKMLPGTGQELRFPRVKQEGVYTVRAYRGCVENMSGSVTIRIGDIPDAIVADPYYYCSDMSGAVIEVKNTERGSVFRLYEKLLTYNLLDEQVSTRTGSSIQFDVVGVYHKEYMVSVRTRYGCYRESGFTVERDSVPKPFELAASSNHVCENNCTVLTLLGSEKNVEYTLYNAISGDEKEFVIGEGKPFSFGPICEIGTYYVVGNHYYYPHCDTEMKNRIKLAGIDTIREYRLESDHPYYCLDDEKIEGGGATVGLIGSQEGVTYELYADGKPTSYPQLHANVDNIRIEWTGVKGAICDGGAVSGTSYTVLARKGGCSKFMSNSLKISAERPLSESDITFTPVDHIESCEGDKVAFNVTVNGGCNPQYKWYRGAVMQIATGSSLVIDQVKLSDYGIYTCEVSNTCKGKIRTGRTELRVAPAAKIEMPIRSVSLCQGMSGYIYSQINNVHAEDYRWYRTDHPDSVYSTQAYLEFASVSPQDAGQYVCEGRGACRTVKDTFMLKVDYNLDSLRLTKILDTVCVHSPYTIKIDRWADYSEMTWKFNGVATAVKGYEYIIKDVLPGNDGIYSIAIKNACGEHELPVRQLIVDDSIQALDWADDIYTCANTPMDLYIKTDPMVRVSYDWYEGQKWIGSGASIRTIVGDDNVSRTFRVFYENTCKRYWKDVHVSVTSSLHIDNPPKEILLCSNPALDTTLCVGVSGTDVFGYTWIYQKKKEAVKDTLGHGSCQKIKAVTNNTGFYYCILETACRTITSDATWVKIDTVPTVMNLQTRDTLCEGGTLPLTVTGIGGGGLVYNWWVEFKDGRSELLMQDEGVDFTSSSVFVLGPVTAAYDGAYVKCVVTNVCGKDSIKMLLTVDRARELLVAPQDTTVCGHSPIDLRVELKNGTAPWNFRYVDTLGRETMVRVENLSGLVTIPDPGLYEVFFIRDGSRCNYAKGQKQFIIRSKPTPEAKMFVVGKDTLCPGEKAQLKIEISYPGRDIKEPLPQGPWEVVFVHKNGTIADELQLTSPYYIYRDGQTGETIEHTIKPFALAKSDTFYMASIRDMGQGIGEVCSGQPPKDGITFIVGGLDTLRFNFRSERDTLGYCNYVKLDTLLNPNMPGTFYVDGIVPTNNIFNQPPLPGKHLIEYKLDGACPSKNGTVRLWVMDKPRLELTPSDTSICQGGSADVLLNALCYAPFKLKYQLQTILRDGSSMIDVKEKTTTPVVVKVNYSSQDDSLRILTPLYLIDKYGCWADRVDTIQGIVRMRDYPKYEVFGKHQDYDKNEWTTTRNPYIIAEGDSVAFKPHLISEGCPWILTLISPTETRDYGPIAAPDTILYGKAAGYYRYSIKDAFGCYKPLGTISKEVLYKEKGYIRVKALLEGPYNEVTGRMNSDLQRLKILPLKGLAQWPNMGNDSIVDWITVEAREKINSPAVASDTFLLRSDGQLVTADGSDLLGLRNTGKLVGSSSYYIVLKHRNHISVMSASAVQIVDEENIVNVKSVDFTIATHVYCPQKDALSNHMLEIKSGVWVMAAGYDLSVDYLVSISNPNATKFASDKETEADYKGYFWRDITMNGIVEWPDDINPGSNIQEDIILKKLYKNRDAWILHKNRHLYSSVPAVK